MTGSWKSVVVLAVVAAAACGSGGGDREPTDEERREARLVIDVCSRFVTLACECELGESESANYRDCTWQTFFSACPTDGALAQSIADGYLTIHEPSVRACFEALRDLPACDPPPDVCDAAVEPMQDDGDPCHTDDECMWEGSSCVRAPANVELGTCG
ncbi:MAG: hypothetical protein A2Y38_22720 [Spirochaetes bacterium GWB1_59_5]|nr:MAG: hypothetical protein A2Y38_22720 [Spirochaetes bacterium GWB1_59_5]